MKGEPHDHHDHLTRTGLRLGCSHRPPRQVQPVLGLRRSDRNEPLWSMLRESVPRSVSVTRVWEGQGF